MKQECFITGTRPDIIKFMPLILKMKKFYDKNRL